jgi:hypothetical protein
MTARTVLPAPKSGKLAEPGGAFGTGQEMTTPVHSENGA